MPEPFEPRIVGFLCNWCSYAGADLAGTSRLSYPPNIRIVRVPCSGRVDPLFVARAFKEGADGVLVLGCHPGDCHYSDGNYYTRRRFAVMHELLQFLGYERERVRLDWVSASEGAKFAKVVGEFTERVRALGPAAGRGAAERGRGGAGEKGSSTSSIQLPASSFQHPTSNLQSINEALRSLAAKLLADGVNVVLGWEQGSVGERPLFARTPEQAARLIVPADLGRALNLTNYLRNLRRDLRGQKVAVVVRPADARAINVLIREEQLQRSDLVLIGLGGEAATVGRGSPLPANVYDHVLGEMPVLTDVTLPTLPLLDELERWPVQQRAAFWQAEFAKCQRCYACRQACPLCYCAECMSEQLTPAWQSIAIEPREQEFFHAMRAFHQAGRCTGCDACSTACPEGVPLYLLNQKVAREMHRLFDGYIAGLSAEQALPFTTFRKDETLAGGHA